MKRRFSRVTSSFTLVEMLTVIAIIAILAGLVLSAASGVMKTTARSRARSEMAAMSAALESYHEDNGIYPPAANFPDNNYPQDAAPTGPIYQLSSQTLYQALTGQNNYLTAAPAGTKIYMSFKASQLGNTTAGANTYIKDPFGNSYGYFTGSGTAANQLPNNGTNQYDLWSTGGDVAQPGVTNSWISNWGLGG